MNPRFLRTVSALVVASLAWSQLPAGAHSDSRAVTLDDLRGRYPGCRFREVTMTEFAALASNPATNAEIVVAPGVPVSDTVVTNAVPPTVEPPAVAPWAGRPRPPPRDRSAYLDTSCVNVFGSIDVGDADAAVVVFVIVGVVVVAAAIVYTGAFAIGALTYDRENVAGWGEADLRSHFFFGGERAGGMYGVHAAGGFMTDLADVGLALEGGYLHGKLHIDEEDVLVDVSDAYGMVGPTVRWVMSGADNPLMLEMELLAGLSSGENLDWLSRAEVGFSWGLGGAWRMGLSLGSLYMHVSTSEGPATTDSQFNLTGGLHAGRAF